MNFWDEFRRRRPLVLNVTNLVAMDLSANVLLATGAAPLMSQAPEEIDELTALADAVVVNGGTLDDRWVALAERALAAAATYRKPTVLDPVGAGASRFRTETFLSLLDRRRVTVVRGNASEILALDGAEASARGVDATDSVDAAKASARSFARKFATVCVVSGPVDFITDGSEDRIVTGGDPKMTQVTAIGCSASALIAATLAVEPRPAEAAAQAMRRFAEAGETAASRATGPGSFRMAFVDALGGTR